MTPKPIVTPPPAKQKPEFDAGFTFRLRRHKGGSFNGLWELTLLNKMGHIEKVITDADALPYCLDNVQDHLEEAGF